MPPGLFAQRSVNEAARWDGLFFGDYRLFLAQLAGIGITIAVAVAGTLICVAVIRIFTPLRGVSERRADRNGYFTARRKRVPKL